MAKPGLARHIALSFGPTILAFLTGIIGVPIILTTLGGSTWAAVAVGQAVGGFGATAVMYGWSAVGPTTVAALKPQGQAQFMADSFGPRLWLLTVVLPISCTIAWFVAPAGGHAWLTVLQCAALVPGGLNGVFYYTGSSRPDLMIVYDALPRAGATVIGLALLVWSHQMVWYILFQFLCDALLVFFVVRRARSFGARFHFGLTHARKQLIEHRTGVLWSVVSTAVGALPLTLVSSFRAPNIESFALLERVRGYAVGGLSPLVMTAQGRLYDPDPAVMHRRVRTAAQASVIGGLAMGGLFLAIGAWVARLLSHGGIAPSWQMVVPFAAGLGLIVISDMVGAACLLTLGGVRDAAASWVLAAIVGAPAIALCAGLGGAVAAAWAVTGMQAVALVWQTFSLVRRLKAPYATSGEQRQQVGAVAALDEGLGELGEPLV